MKMEASNQAYKIIKAFEGCRLRAYLDSADVPTISYGATYYEDGSKVQLGEQITQNRAEALLSFHITEKVKEISPAIKVALNQNQFDAIVSFVYNIGGGAFKKSTLLKKLNVDPNDKTIADEFARWNKAGGKVLQDLINRRKQESDLYFKI